MAPRSLGFEAAVGKVGTISRGDTGGGLGGISGEGLGG